MHEHEFRSVETSELRAAYLEFGTTGCWPVILSHGRDLSEGVAIVGKDR